MNDIKPVTFVKTPNSWVSCAFGNVVVVLFFFCFALAAEKVCGDYTWIGVQTIAEKRDTQDILLREHGTRIKENPKIELEYVTILRGWSACLLGWDKDLGHMGELAWRGSIMYTYGEKCEIHENYFDGL